jgi:hypothetical protein
MRFYTSIEGGPSPSLILTGELQDFLTLADALESQVATAAPGAIVTLPELEMDGTDIRSFDFQVAPAEPIRDPAAPEKLSLSSKLWMLSPLIIIPALICFIRGLIFLLTHPR